LEITALKLPQTISITIRANGAPLEGIPAMLSFVMKQKNHHSLVFGPSDASGTIRVTADEIRREARKTMELFLMDYSDIDAYWSGILRVTPMNREALKGALSAFRRFRSYEFPAGYEKMLFRADTIVSKIPTEKIDSTVQCETAEPIKIETVPVQAQSSVARQ
jgi:hypothetical protein